MALGGGVEIVVDMGCEESKVASATQAQKSYNAENLLKMNYIQLLTLVEGLETKWLANLDAVSHLDSRIANGEAQFFDIEDAAGPKVDSAPVTLVVAIGANFAQKRTSAPWVSPYRKSTGTGKPVVVTLPSSPMRKHLDETFHAYSTDAMGWKVRRLASDENLHLPKHYILIATNFSPLITFEPWQDYSPQYRAHLLTLFRCGFDYLDDLLLTLKRNGIEPPLLVGHGLDSEVPVLFRRWQTTHKLQHWLLTQNMGRPLSAHPNVFYKKSPPVPPPPRKADLLNEPMGDD